LRAIVFSEWTSFLLECSLEFLLQAEIYGASVNPSAGCQSKWRLPGPCKPLLFHSHAAGVQNILPAQSKPPKSLQTRLPARARSLLPGFPCVFGVSRAKAGFFDDPSLEVAGDDRKRKPGQPVVHGSRISNTRPTESRSPGSVKRSSEGSSRIAASQLKSAERLSTSTSL